MTGLGSAFSPSPSSRRDWRSGSRRKRLWRDETELKPGDQVITALRCNFIRFPPRPSKTSLNTRIRVAWHRRVLACKLRHAAGVLARSNRGLDFSHIPDTRLGSLFGRGYARSPFPDLDRGVLDVALQTGSTLSTLRTGRACKDTPRRTGCTM